MRAGRCLRCGRCCIAADRFHYRVKAFILPDEPNYETLEVLPPRPGPVGAPCEKLIYDIRTREAACLRQEIKPEVCRRYPLSTVDRLPECGFIFTKEDKGCKS